MKKQITFLLAIFLMVAISCTKDNNDSKDPDPEPEECIKKSLTKTIVGKWKVENKNATVEFNSDKTYTDASKVLHECEAGKWDVYNGDKDFELECGGNYIFVYLVDSFTCDTVAISLDEDFTLIREK